MTKAPEPVLYIDTQAALRAWAERCHEARRVAVDTESDSFHRYREKVCLIQMTALGQDVIIDTLALSDIEVLRPLFEDKERIKIFHDACYDLVCLRRDFGFECAAIFDTMVASRLLGEQSFGLGHILLQRFGFHADKRFQRSDWGQRPLAADQVSYARYDTHYLHQLADILTSELRDIGRWEWAQEEFSRIPDSAGRIEPRAAEPDPDGFWRIRGVRRYTPEVQGRLRSLHLVREEIAQKLDRPPFKVFGNAVLLDLALDPPGALSDFEPRPGLRRSGIERFGAEIVGALKRSKPVYGDPPRPRPRHNGRLLDHRARRTYEALRRVRRRVAEKLGLDPEVALGNAVLEQLAQAQVHTIEELMAVPELQGWRKAHFSAAILETLQHPED